MEIKNESEIPLHPSLTSDSKTNTNNFLNQGSKMIPYRCTHCKFQSKYSHSLVRHMHIHGVGNCINTGERNIKKKIQSYQCPQCNYKCNRRVSLARHLLIHTETKRYHCIYIHSEYSDKAFWYRE